MRYIRLAATLLSVVVWSSAMCGEPVFGHVSYTGGNIGDDIQSIAARRFLPSNSVSIDRDTISRFRYPSPVKAIINGWFMQTGLWPPPKVVEPLLISIHTYKVAIPKMFTPEGIEYFKKYSPVGARDYPTLKELQKRGIPSYFSGCLTLTLDNPFTDREDVIYAVDVPEQIVSYIKSRTTSNVVTVTHLMSFSRETTQGHRQKVAERLLNAYRKAKCVITTRLHAAMPCLAFKTPVLMIIGDKNDPRFPGLIELVRHCSADEFLKGKVQFDVNNPPENPTAYLSIREQLIETVTNWVQQQKDGALFVVKRTKNARKRSMASDRKKREFFGAKKT